MTVQIRLTEQSIQEAIDKIQARKDELMSLCRTYLQELAKVGLECAKAEMAGHVFSGETINSLKVTECADTATGHRFKLEAASEAILFMEFGTGITYSETKHPYAKELGMGPGTFSPAGHWDDPRGWYYPTSDPRLIVKRDENGQGYGHSYGNPPYMPMYKSAREIEARATDIARSVFNVRE